MTGKKILIHQRILPHYRAGVFSRFSEKFAGLKIVFGNPCKGESLKNVIPEPSQDFVEVRNIYPTGSPKIFFSGLMKILKEFKPDVVISVFNTGNLNLYLLFLLRRMLGYKLILWSFGYDPIRGFEPDKSFSDKIRKQMCLKADAVIFYWEEGKKVVENVMGRRSNFFVASNTLDTIELETLRRSFEEMGKIKIKEELGVKEEFHFIYIGRLIEDKQIDLLIKAFGILSGKYPNSRLTIIGEGPKRSALEELARETEGRIVFAGEINDDEQTGKWIFVSDAFVMPGRLGLSVAHSFCFGTPVISQKKDGYFHGEGIGYLHDGYNGFHSEDGDIQDLAAKMEMTISDKKLSETLRENALNTASTECSVSNMMNGFERAIEYALNNR